MKALLKAVISAAAFGVVVAGGVILYMEHKIDQVTEAAVAPVVETRERVEEAIDEVERSVNSVVDSGAGAVEDLATSLDSTYDEVSNRLQGLGEDSAAFVESTLDLSGNAVGDGAGAVKEFWESTRSGMVESRGS